MWVWEEVGHYSKVVRVKVLKCVSLQLHWIYMPNLWKVFVVLFSDFILFVLLCGDTEMLTIYCAQVMYTEINIMVLLTPSITA
jgi:hypothetical protein